ncbi:MAG: RpiB/LacA/LacB family sugar-phosphate isomerase [Candidatus Vogelbacteria bacterium]|nr:RpiB/LacA/LacB family sugar-phosphate isomerase [Candidatus Vogelbacteria bacterium]
MKIFLGADHAGFELKEELKIWLKGLGYEVFDEGAFEKKEQDDYPAIMRIVAQQIIANSDSLGIILGGSGQGEAMVANRIRGVRAAVYYGGPEEIIQLSRSHNNANILSLGARFITTDEAKQAVKLWLETPFSDKERHTRRVAQFDCANSNLPDF